jgi:hypothetical protein
MFYVFCPHCQGQVLIEQVNCRIFRHAVYKETGEPINPHATQEECNRLIVEQLIYGCAGPFRLNDQDVPEICGYI